MKGIGFSWTRPEKWWKKQKWTFYFSYDENNGILRFSFTLTTSAIKIVRAMYNT